MHSGWPGRGVHLTRKKKKIRLASNFPQSKIKCKKKIPAIGSSAFLEGTAEEQRLQDVV